MQINCIPESKKITNLRKRAVERAAQTQKLAIADKIVALKDSYVVSGFVDKFPFCKWDSLELKMKVKGGEVDFGVPLETEIVEDEKLHWEAKIDYETLREHIEEPKRSNWQKQICNFVIAITSADGEQLELKVVSLQGCC